MKKINFDQLFFNSILDLKKKNLDRRLRLLTKIDAVKVRYKQKTLLNF